MQKKFLKCIIVAALFGSTTMQINKVDAEAIVTNDPSGLVLESTTIEDTIEETEYSSNSMSEMTIDSSTLETDTQSIVDYTDQPSLYDDKKSEQSTEIKQTIVDQQTLVEIPDEGLAKVIRIELGLAENEPITVSDMNRLTKLSATNLLTTDIRSLEGLQYATNLVTLTMYNEQISDLSPLANLVNLEEVNFALNYRINDLSPLAGLSKLKKVDMSYNSITDISPIANLVDNPAIIIRIDHQKVNLEDQEVITLPGTEITWEEQNLIVVPSTLLPNSIFYAKFISGFTQYYYDSDRSVFIWNGFKTTFDKDFRAQYEFEVSLPNGNTFSGSVTRYVTVKVDTEPSTTEPSTTEPSTTEPSTTEPSTTEPSTTEPSTTEPSTTESSTTEPSTTESSATKSYPIANQTNGSNGPTKKSGYLPRTGEEYYDLSVLLLGMTLSIGSFIYLILVKNRYTPKHSRK